MAPPRKIRLESVLAAKRVVSQAVKQPTSQSPAVQPSIPQSAHQQVDLSAIEQAVETPRSVVDELPSLAKLEAELDRRRNNRLASWFPDTGPLRRELYVKHMEFFRASREHSETLFMAANRVGKSVVGSLASTFHSTGLYPHWWEGHVFTKPTTGWALNKTATDCRDINQLEMLGQFGQFGTGMIPRDCIVDTKPKPSVPAAVSIAYVRHVSGGISTVFYKSYDQGREQFQGRAIDWIWADEEIPADVYTECLLRLMTTAGIIFCTYTPIYGLSKITLDFLTNSVNKDTLPIKFNHDRSREPGK